MTTSTVASPTSRAQAREMSAREWSILQSGGTEITLVAGDTLLEKPEEANYLYRVSSGKLSVRQGTSSLISAGREVYACEKGDLINEEAVMGTKRANYVVTATVGPAHLWKIPRDFILTSMSPSAHL